MRKRSSFRQERAQSQLTHTQTGQKYTSALFLVLAHPHPHASSLSSIPTFLPLLSLMVLRPDPH